MTLKLIGFSQRIGTEEIAIRTMDQDLVKQLEEFVENYTITQTGRVK